MPVGPASQALLRATLGRVVPTVVIVSGAPRAGTSLMMQMLEAGGTPPLADGARAADAGNPRGYYELEAVKRLPDDAGWLAQAAGRAVKVVYARARSLPEGPRYRVLWMERDLSEVVRSQRALLAGMGREPEDDLSDARVAEVLGQQLEEVARALDGRADVERLVVRHADLIAAPLSEAERVDRFLGGGLAVAAMAARVDPALYRIRAR